MDPYAAWRIPDFRRLLLGRLFFITGTQAQAMALGWEVYTRTNDPFSLGLVALVKGLPMLLLTLPAGVMADRFNRRNIMVTCLSGATLTSVLLALASYHTSALWVIYALLFLDSCFMRMTTPSGQSLMPLLLPRHLFENGVKWQSNTFQFTALAGPTLGGILLAWNLQAVYIVCACTSLVFIAMLLRIRIPVTPPKLRAHWLLEAAEGLRFVWSKKILLGAVSLDLFAVLFGGATYLLPVFARDLLPPVLGLSPEKMLGLLNAAPFAGALSMGFLVAHRPPFRRAGRTMFLGVTGFGIATILFGFSRNFWLSAFLLFLTGAFDNLSVVVRHTLVNLITPDPMRGRVTAVNSIFIGSSNELGGFESGTVARFFGPVVSVVSGGIATLVVVVLWMGLFPRLRRFGSLVDATENNT
jgi:MFS family permease